MFKIRNSLAENIKAEEKSNRRFLGFTAVFVLILSVIFFLLTEVFFVVLVYGESMEPTLHSGDVLVVNSYGSIDNGDVIIVDHKGKWLIKRAIGVEGDRIKIKDGNVLVNGKILQEDYIKKQGSTENLQWSENEYLVGEGEIFYLGDNRLNSSDSRIYGVCTTDDVKGVVENWSYNVKGISLFLHRLFYSSNVSSD